MIQGFVNSPGLMQSCIMTKIDFPALKKILESKLDAEVLSYLDDIGGGIKNGCPYNLLHLILELCVEANLTFVPENIQIGSEVTHLGKLLNARCEIDIAARHRSAISSLPFPSCPDLAHRCTAFLNYFRDFIPRFAPLTAELRCLTHSKPFCMTTTVKNFEEIKILLLSALPLRLVPSIPTATFSSTSQ